MQKAATLLLSSFIELHSLLVGCVIVQYRLSMIQSSRDTGGRREYIRVFLEFIDRKRDDLSVDPRFQIPPSSPPSANSIPLSVEIVNLHLSLYTEGFSF